MSRARPLPPLGALCAIQVAIAAWFALRTPHNGWLWYSGGDATEYWTYQWALSHLWLPQTRIGWGIPVLYSWVPRLTGQTILSGLPIIVLFHLLVVVPLVVVLVWLMSDRLFGRLYAWGATALWIAAPLLLVWGMRRHDYRVEFEQNFLAPHVYGLTDMADFPSVAIVLATGWATLRALDAERTEEWVFAGLLAGLAIGIKPANAFYIVAVAVLLALARRARGALIFGVALLPAVIALVIWKQRGLGSLPLFAAGQTREAAGSTVVAVSPTSYLPFDLHHLKMELRDLMEVFWSVRLLEWAALAGIVAALRRSPARGCFLAVWFLGFCVVKGSSNQADVSTTSYFRLTEPGLPAFVLLVASLPFLVPLRRRLWPPRPAPRPVPRWAVVVTAVIGAAAPLALIVAARPQRSPPVTAFDLVHSTQAPISSSLTASPANGRLSWRPVAGHGSRVHYALLRVDAQTGGCTTPNAGSAECQLKAKLVQTVRVTSIPLPASGTYRIAAAANYKAAVNGSDMLLLGPPVVVP